MATHDIFMPALSSTMTEGKIVEWLKQPGEKVERGESVLVVESDKADMDVESFHEGYLAVVLMPAGTSAPVGETIGLIVESQEEIASAQSNAPVPISAAAKVDKQKESSKASEKIVAQTSSKEEVPKPLEASTPKGKLKDLSSNKPQVINDGRIISSPRARKLASQLGVDLSMVQGTGPHGRVQAEDVLAAKGQPVSVPWVAESDRAAASEAQADSSSSLQKSLPNGKSKTSLPQAGKSFGERGEEISFNTLQQAVNRNMEASLAVPCFRVGYSIITNNLDFMYRELKPKGVTMTALLSKAVGLTLARHPQVNAACGSEGMSYPSDINVAVAVAMEDGGLITPVLKNVDRTNLFDLSRQWADLVKRSREKQLQPDEYSTGTFTLSNLGMFGVDRFDAILPPGTGAILAVGASKQIVVADQEGAISVKRQMQVNLTADHRVIYGADGAAFLKDLAYLIEINYEEIAS